MARLPKDTLQPGEDKILDFFTGNPVNLDSSPPIAAQIKALREAAGLEQKEIASKLGLTANAISNWENGRSRPDVRVLPRLCTVLGASPSELLGLDDFSDQYSEVEASIIDQFRSLTGANQEFLATMIQSLLRAQEQTLTPELKVIQFLDKPLAAGIGDPAEFDEHFEPMYLYPSPLVDKADWVFEVNGDSMEPEFQSSDMVFVQAAKNAPDLTEGTVGAFITETELYIKEYRYDGLYSFNGRYRPKLFKSMGDVYYIGRVIGKVRDKDIPKRKEIDLYKRAHGIED